MESIHNEVLPIGYSWEESLKKKLPKLSKEITLPRYDWASTMPDGYCESKVEDNMRNIHDDEVAFKEPNLDQPDNDVDYLDHKSYAQDLDSDEEDEDLETDNDWFDDEDEDIDLDSEEEDAS